MYKISKRAYTIGIVILILSVVCIVVFVTNKSKNDNIPNTPAFMYNDKIYIVTPEEVSNYGNLNRVGEINNYIEVYNLTQNNQGYFMPKESYIYELNDGEDTNSLMDTLAVEFSGDIAHGSKYTKGKYYIARNVIQRKNNF